MKFPTPQRLTDRIFKALKSEIITCRLAPGEMLNELEVARRFKTSRTPIREACNRLTQERFLVSVPNKGHIVASISIKDILSLYELRFIVETACAESAATRLSDSEIQELEELLKLEENPEEVDKDDLIEMNKKFHRKLASGGRNERIIDLMELLLLESVRLDYFLMDCHPGTWTKHSEIMAALKARDGAQARKAMAEHIQLAQERMSKVFSSEVFPGSLKSGVQF
jgi:DNA-binding GntR family transcriptional regulator